MNRLVIRKPLALLLSLVMLVSSALVYVPAFASVPDEIVEGTEIIGLLRGDPSNRVFLVESQYEEGGYHDWVIVGYRATRRGPRPIYDLFFHHGVEDDDQKLVEISSTMYLEPGDYDIIVTTAFTTVRDDITGRYEEFADIVSEYDITVTTNQPPNLVDDYDVEDFDMEATEDVKFEMDFSGYFEDGDGHDVRIDSISTDVDFGHDETSIWYMPPENWNSGETSDDVIEGTFTVVDVTAFNTKELIVEFSVDFRPVDDTPTAGDIAVETDKNVPKVVDIAGYVSDVESEDLELVAGSVVAYNSGEDIHGTITGYTTSGFTFTPDNDFVGTVFLKYTVTEKNSADTDLTADGMIELVVVDPGTDNQAPYYNGTVFEVDEGQQDVPFDWMDYVTDPDGDPLSLVSGINPSVGNMEGDEVDGFFYDHDGSEPNPSGADGTIEFTVNDGEVDAIIVVEIEVDGQNDTLQAIDDNAQGREDNRAFVDVVANDIYGDFEEIRVINGYMQGTKWVNAEPSHGDVWVSSQDPHVIVYEPDNDFVGMDTFAYEIEDKDGQTSIGVVLIDIKGKNDNLRWMNNDTMYTREGRIVEKNVLKNDKFWSDVEFIFIKEQPKHGTVDISTNGVARYEANPTYDGWDHFKYEVRLESGEIGCATVWVWIGEVDKIILMDDVRSAWENSEENWYPISDNDIILAGIGRYWPYGDASSGDGPFHGTVEYDMDDGVLWANYVPNPGYHGIDTFRYMIRDNDWWYDIASVIVNVVPVEHEEHRFKDFFVSTPSNMSVQVDVSDQQFVPEFDTDSLSVITHQVIKEPLVAPVSTESVGFTLIDPPDPNDPRLMDIDVGVNGTLLTFTPGGDLGTATFRYDLRDDLGHYGYGLIDIFVFISSGERMIDVTIHDPVYVDQYADNGLELVREGVVYYGEDEDTLKYEKRILGMGQHFYDDSLKQGNGLPLPIHYYYGDFTIRYYMLNGSETTVSEESRQVIVNGRPIISMGDVNPEDIMLPEGGVDLDAEVALSVDDETYYREFDILDELYGYDYEDYNHDGLDIFPVEDTLNDMPTDLEVKFRLPNPDEDPLVDGDEYLEFPIDEFWDVLLVGDISEGYEPLGSTMTSWEDIDGNEIDFSVYEIQFAMVDTLELESFWTPVWTLKVMNNPPEIEGVMPYDILTVDDLMDPMAGIEVIDPEDLQAAMPAPEGDVTPSESEPLYLPLEQYIDFMIYDEIADDYVDLEAVDINELEPGVYRFLYSYEDMHGVVTEEQTLMIILTNPLLMLEPEIIEMEPNGWYPVYNGLRYDDSELYDLLNESGIWYSFHTELGAFIDDGDGLVYLEELVQLDESEEIIYKLFVELHFDPYEVGPSGGSQEPPYYDTTQEYTRQVLISDEDMGQIIYLVDTWRPFETGYLEEHVEEPPLGEPPSVNEEGRIEPACSYLNVYPLLMKLNPETGRDRLVTAVTYDYDVRGQDIYFYRYGAPDDIAVSETGEIYILKGRWMYEFNHETMMFEELFNVADELADYARAFDFTDSDGSWWIHLQSLTIDERGYLVLALEDSSLNDMLNTDYDFEYYDSLLLFFDPDGFVPDMPDKGDQGTEPGVTQVDPPPILLDVKYLVELALIDWGTVTYDDGNGGYEMDKEPYHFIGDLAFSEEGMIYGIGGYRYDPTIQDSVEPSSHMNNSPDKYFELFALEVEPMPEPDPELSEGTEDANGSEGLDRDDFAEYYRLTTFNELEFGYKYKGLAVVGEQIYITRYMSSRLLDRLNDMNNHTNGVSAAKMQVNMVEVDLYRTELLEFGWEDGFVDREDMMHVHGMFMAATGAAGLETLMTLDPTNRNITLYNDESATSKTASFALTTMPEESYVDIDWTVDSAHASYVTHEGNGLFRLTTAVDGDMTINFTVSAMNLYSGSLESIPGTIVVDYRIRPNDDDDDDDGGSTGGSSAPSTPTIRVSLDTDAVTLDYGETADPEFTSYDFTETVTGTDDERVTWSLSDDEFVEVDENGVVTAKAGVPADTGDFTVTLTVRTVDGGATDTATILFQEQVPLGAIDFFDPYIAGYPDGTFRSKNHVTRAEVASMFAKILKMNLDYPGTQKFSDVPETHWAYAQVQAMFRSGLFVGYLDTEGSRYFDPEAPISRAEIAQVFTNYWNYLDISVNGGTTTPITDVPDTLWAAPAINRIYNTGVVTSFTDGTYRPYDPTLREQIVYMINRLIERPPNQAPASKFNDITPDATNYGDIEAASQTYLKLQDQ
ncbi:Ig-like domain-containing protein [Acidaminobacter sp. JC074]|uniref:Ig-like domain-containing protein n=1 Tax=Acidaminobacter sp. JC074 TaxID=2530199 RepID=UPI001F0EF563|nr:Ig-like domain-containing protein [Acidaminobacter sp. JC074]